jgi:hypothetical protein
MKKLVLATLPLALAACVSTADRPMNDGEATFVSQEVRKIVEKSEEGLVDTREFPDIRCRRFKRVGSHMVNRYCYTKDEEDEALQRNHDTMRDRWAKQPCLDNTIGGPCDPN